MQISKFTPIKLNNCYQHKNQDRIHFGNSFETATQLTRVLKDYIRIAEPPNTGTGIQTVCDCIGKRLQALIQKEQPIRIVMPAFPFKSPSPQKVLGRNADMAEFDCLRLFKELLSKIGEVYAPGAKMKIYSDGYPIAPIMHVDEAEVQAYSDRVMEFAVRNGLEGHFNMHSLKDTYNCRTIEDSLNSLMSDYGVSAERTRLDIIDNPDMRNDFCGIHRFVREEQSVLHPELSKSAIEKQSKAMAYEIVRFDSAWGKLIEQQEPDALRISCHPQLPDSKKIGIRFSRNSNNWITPWHSSAVRVDEDAFVLMKRKQAEDIGLAVVYDAKGQPSHFEIPATASSSERTSIREKILEISPLNQNLI
ncbi:MAG: L-tyrosine/L-tryptophan isonitrile synthase family protein [Candidatus Gastranaerophilaceae bacterium]